jgi:hypothetical protein
MARQVGHLALRSRRDAEELFERIVGTRPDDAAIARLLENVDDADENGVEDAPSDLDAGAIGAGPEGPGGGGLRLGTHLGILQGLHAAVPLAGIVLTVRFAHEPLEVLIAFATIVATSVGADVLWRRVPVRCARCGQGARARGRGPYRIRYVCGACGHVPYARGPGSGVPPEPF